jgi:hypothetical protein
MSPVVLDEPVRPNPNRFLASRRKASIVLVQDPSLLTHSANLAIRPVCGAPDDMPPR